MSEKTPQMSLKNSVAKKPPTKQTQDTENQQKQVETPLQESLIKQSAQQSTGKAVQVEKQLLEQALAQIESDNQKYLGERLSEVKYLQQLVDPNDRKAQRIVI